MSAINQRSNMATVPSRLSAELSIPAADLQTLKKIQKNAEENSS